MQTETQSVVADTLLLCALCIAKLTHKLPKVSFGSLLDIIFERLAILLIILALHPHHVSLIPMHAHEPRDQEFVPKLIITILVSDILDRVLQQKSVSSRSVDDTI